MSFSSTIKHNEVSLWIGKAFLFFWNMPLNSPWLLIYYLDPFWMQSLLSTKSAPSTEPKSISAHSSSLANDQRGITKKEVLRWEKHSGMRFCVNAPLITLSSWDHPHNPCGLEAEVGRRGGMASGSVCTSAVALLWMPVPGLSSPHLRDIHLFPQLEGPHSESAVEMNWETKLSSADRSFLFYPPISQKIAL